MFKKLLMTFVLFFSLSALFAGNVLAMNIKFINESNEVITFKGSFRVCTYRSKKEQLENPFLYNFDLILSPGEERIIRNIPDPTVPQPLYEVYGQVNEIHKVSANPAIEFGLYPKKWVIRVWFDRNNRVRASLRTWKG